jgi:CBS domain-containing protein
VIRPDVAFRIAEPSVVSALPVREIMRSGVVTVKAEETLTAATELMVSTRLRSLPVIRRTGGKSRLVGIVTQGDVMRAFQSQVLDTVAG